MKLGARTRLALVVILGVVAGLGFITIPNILAVPSASSPSTTTTGTNSTSGTTTSLSGGPSARLANSTKTQTPTEETITLGALSVLVSLIVIPALTLSLLTSTLVSKRTRTSLESAPENNSIPTGSTDS